MCSCVHIQVTGNWVWFIDWFCLWYVLLAIFIIYSVSSVLNAFMLLYMFITWLQSFKKPSQLALLKFHFRLCLLSIE